MIQETIIIANEKAVISFIKKWKYDMSFLNFVKYLNVSIQSKIPINAVITIKILKSILFYFLFFW